MTMSVWIGKGMCEDMREWICEDLRWKCEKSMFELWYVRLNVWEKFIGSCEWYDCCEGILIFFSKDKKYKITNLPLSLKIFE